MTSTPSVAPPDPSDLATPATLAEVTQLWWFCDGAIMDVGTREQLHRSWGLCPRHAWLYFRAENDLKYQPLGNAVLYHDLAARAVELLTSHHRSRTKWHRLAGADSCLTCDYVSTAAHGRDHFADDLATVRNGARTRDWFTGSIEVWQTRHCPRCPNTVPRDQAPPTDPANGLPCRIHLLADADEPDPGNVADYLAALTDRHATCEKSMTVDGPARTANTDAALVEALAWFAGWPPAPGSTTTSLA